ncbi:hypothetical protein DPMN_027135 [Dreissena polymorpha]|uniref:Uncharacterized protein n=1 Tax=Dreissena polymorpha TaxID=45954 RepID=A0A9D4RD70_DREPO|nr:hypothetical protein DPMN_027135 [Dreissena polymorpha]
MPTGTLMSVACYTCTFFHQVTLAEEFRYDHDLTFHIEYHKPFVPRLIMESGNSEKG